MGFEGVPARVGKMSGKATDLRDKGEVDYVSACEELKAVVGAATLKKRAVTKGITLVQKSWEKLKSLHADYCRASKIGITSSDSTAYIAAMGKIGREAIEAAEDLLGENKAEDEKAEMMEEANQLKMDVEIKLVTLSSLSNTDLSGEKHGQALGTLDRVENLLKQYMETSNKAVGFLEQEERAEKLDSVQKFYKETGREIEKCRVIIIGKTPVKVEPETSRRVQRDDQHEDAQGGVSQLTKQPVKIKAMEPPKWDGKYRTFTRFKLLWDENIAPRIADSAQHMMLCESLPKHILDNISTMSNSAEDIWKYLDEKYGRSDIVAREVMSELLSLDHKKLGKKFMGKFFTMMMDTHACLTAIGEQDWLVSNSRVAEMEDKLPREEKLVWAEKMITVEGSTKFEKFKNFLESRKKVMDSMDTMGTRLGGQVGDKCGYCNKPNHAENQCYIKQRDEERGEGKGFPKGKGGCAICGDMEHWKNECPDRNTERDRKFSGNRGGKANSGRGKGKGGKQDGSGGDGTKSVEVGSNTLRALDCARCKAAAKLTSCAGCKKTSNINHCLAHCTSFMVMGVDDRVNVVKTSKSCAVCLHPSHTTDRCLNKSKDNYICGVDNCQSHHHPSLHGSADTFATSVNVLLRQQSKAVLCGSQQAYQPIEDWHDRVQYYEDSYSIKEWKEEKREVEERKKEVEEILKELSKPLIDGDKVLLVMQGIQVVHGMDRKKTRVLGFWDDGSNCSVIRNDLATKLQLWGDPVTLELGTVNALTTVDTKLYCVELLDSKGKRHLIKAFGLDSISGELPTINLDGIKHEFSKEVQENWGKVQRETGEVDILIGSEVAHLHPSKFETVGKMVVKKSKFGSGWILNGSHEGIVTSPVKFGNTVQLLRSGCYRSNRISVTYKQQYKFSSVDEYEFELSEKKFMEGEALGCEAPRRCADCRGCSECGFRGANMSQKESLELRMMEDGISFDDNIGKWRVKYPFLRDPRVLENNYRQVLRMMETLEKRLEKLGKIDEANEVFNKMVEIGALEEIGAEELKMWSGPVHYLPIQAVVQEKSMTTPVRLVTNSSLVDRSTGLSLNSILAKGPMYLNDMWEMLVRFKHQEYGLTGDISKAYYQMYTGPLEKHVRRVLWRDNKVGTPWRMYGFTVVSMGDTPASCFMELTRKRTASMGGNLDPPAAERIKKDAFVDDITTGGRKAECVRFKGVEDPVTLRCDGTIPQILAVGGYSVKAMCMSGEPDGEALDKLGGSVLGLGWSTATDLLEVKFRVNISTHKRGKPTGPDLSVVTLDQLRTASITKRVCLRVVSSQYDPLGIACPLLIKLKHELKELYRLGLSWDEELSGNLRARWVSLLEMLVTCGGIKFRRSTRPENAVGKCMLVCFFDGGDPAFCIAIYSRWELLNGTFDVSLVAAKAKVSPMLGSSTPRVELEAATLVTRVALRVVHALADDPPGVVMFLGDSQTILASREREKGFFGEFFGNRIGEQYDNIERMELLVNFDKPIQWYYVSTELNVADRGTRTLSVVEDLGQNSEWLLGPAFLRDPVEEWPINRDFADKKNKVPLPIEEIRRPYREQVLGDHKQSSTPLPSDPVHLSSRSWHDVQLEEGNGQGRGESDSGDGDMRVFVDSLEGGRPIGGPGCLDNYVLDYFNGGYITNDWEKLVRKTALLFKWFIPVSEESAVEVLARDMAITFWVRVAMPATNQALLQGRLKHLSPMKHTRYEDMVVVVGRASKGFQQLFQKEYLPVIMSSTRTAWLIMMWAHNQDHSGVDNTYLTSMQVAWVVGGRSLARGIKRSCVRCRFLAKLLLDQQMSVLPAHLAVPCPCFTYVAVDLAGPFICKREGASRETRRNTGTIKVWAVLYVCLQVKAVKIYMAGGLHTQDFLLTWDSFVADHGQPAIAYSDRGSNLIAAAKQGGDTEVPDYDWDSIASRGGAKTEWKFHPAGSQFRNGLVESFVKKFKRSLVHKYSLRKMFMLELETSFRIIASILNNRPIYARWGPRGGDDPDYLSPLTPNMLLTGRANSEVPVRSYDQSDKPLLRLRYVEDCLAQWWNQYMAQNFTSLVPRQKWFLEKRNMRVGDVVLIQYEGKCKPATYRLGIVTDLEVDPDGLVRTVVVEYSLLSELSEADRFSYKGVTKKKLKVPVQRLVLILPVEERDNFLPGGQAGQDPAPLNEVCSEGQGEVGDAECYLDSNEAKRVVTDKVWKVKNGIREAFKNCAIMKGKIVVEDFEKKVLQVKAEELFDTLY